MSMIWSLCLSSFCCNIYTTGGFWTLPLGASWFPLWLAIIVGSPSVQLIYYGLLSLFTCTLSLVGREKEYQSGDRTRVARYDARREQHID